MYEYLAILRVPTTKYEIVETLDKHEKTVGNMLSFLQKEGWVDSVGHEGKRKVWLITPKGEFELKSKWANIKEDEGFPPPKKDAQSPNTEPNIMDLTEQDLINITELKLNKFKPTLEEAEAWPNEERMRVFYEGLIVRRIIRTKGAK